MDRLDRTSDWVIAQAQVIEKLPDFQQEESPQQNNKKKINKLAKKAKSKQKKKKSSKLSRKHKLKSKPIKKESKSNPIEKISKSIPRKHDKYDICSNQPFKPPMSCDSILFWPRRETKIAYFLIGKRICQLKDVWLANRNAKTIDDIIVSSNVCLLKISEECVAGHVKYKRFQHIVDNIHKDLGTLIMNKFKFPDNINEQFIQDMLRCFLSLSRYELTHSHRLALTHMSVLFHPNLQRKCRNYLSSITNFSPLHKCYATTLLVRIELYALHQIGTKSMDIWDIVHHARQSVEAAKQSRFVPWVFVCYTNLLFSLVIQFGRMRLMNRPYAPHYVFPLSKMRHVRENIIHTLNEFKALSPHVPDEEVQRFISVADQIIRTEITCLDLPQVKCVDPRKLCYRESCPMIMKEFFPWGDPWAKFEGLACYRDFQPLRQEKIYDTRPPPPLPWRMGNK